MAIIRHLIAAVKSISIQNSSTARRTITTLIKHKTSRKSYSVIGQSLLPCILYWCSLALFFWRQVRLRKVIKWILYLRTSSISVFLPYLFIFVDMHSLQMPLEALLAMVSFFQSTLMTRTTSIGFISILYVLQVLPSSLEAWLRGPS